MTADLTPEQWTNLNRAVTHYEASQHPDWHWNAKDLARRHVVTVLLELARPLTDAARPECKACHGQGQVGWERVLPGGSIGEVAVACGDCNGTGWAA